MQSILSMLGSHAAVIAAAKSTDKDTKMLWTLSGVMLGSVFPYTLLVMMPTNKTIIKQVGWPESDYLSSS